jgi:hypothetical protein
VDEVVRDVWEKGVVIEGKCMGYLWVPLKRVRCTYHGCKCFQAHSFPFIFIIIACYFKRLVRGHFPSVVTIGGNVTHKHFTEMRRLDHDETVTGESPCGQVDSLLVSGPLKPRQKGCYHWSLTSF